MISWKQVMIKLLRRFIYENDGYVYTDYTESKSNEVNTTYFVTPTYVVIISCLLTKKRSSGEDMIKISRKIMKTMVTFIWGQSNEVNTTYTL